MNAQKGENNVEFSGKTAIRSTPIMISPPVSEVNPSHLVDFAALRVLCGGSRSCCSIEGTFFNSQLL